MFTVFYMLLCLKQKPDTLGTGLTLDVLDDDYIFEIVRSYYKINNIQLVNFWENKIRYDVDKIGLIMDNITPDDIRRRRLANDAAEAMFGKNGF